MADDFIRIQANCERTWQLMLKKESSLNESHKPFFDKACRRHAEESVGFPPPDQCFWAHKGDKFLIDKNWLMMLMKDKRSVECLLNLAQKEAWAKFITPKSVQNAPEPAVEAPKDTTPAGVGLFNAVTPESPVPTIAQYYRGFWNWLRPFEVLLAGGPRLTSVGLSVNGAEPNHSYDEGSAFALRGSVFLTPRFLGSVLYETQPFVLGQLDNLGGPLGKLWSVGAGAAFRFSYRVNDHFSIALAPDVAASLGVFWMNEPADVGASELQYWAYTGYIFPQAHVGLGVYVDVPVSGLIFTTGVHAGARQLWHGNQMSPLPGQNKTVVGLQSKMFEALQLLLGVRF
jgi:hypothetical protein